MGSRSTKKEVQQVLDGKSLNFYTTKRTNNPDSILLAGLAGKFFNGTNWRSTISSGNIGTLPLTSTNESSNVTGTTGLPSANHRYGVNLWTSIAYGDGLGDNYGFIAIGYFTPPTTGTYTIYTSSDDGSGVWIGELALPGAPRTSANAVLNNGMGSGQGNTKRSGTISLTGGVTYPIRIVHEEGNGGDNLTFSWAGPSITETTSLSTYFSTPATVSGQLTGNYLSSASSLVLDLDAGNSSSYPGSGTTWTNLSPYLYTATLTNGPTYSSADGGSIVFDGSNDYVALPAGSIDTNADFTLNFWNKSPSALSAIRTLLGVSSGTGHFQVRYDSASIQLVNSGVVNIGTFTGFTPSSSTIYLITITLNKSTNTYSLYVNGSFVSTIVSSQTFTTSAPALGINQNVEQFNSNIYAFSYYNRVLSATEITQNFNALRGRFGI